MISYFKQDKFVEVIRHQEFVLLEPDSVVELLSSDSLNVPNEETIFHALVTWCQHDVTERKKHLAVLLAYVRLPLMLPKVGILLEMYSMQNQMNVD